MASLLVTISMLLAQAPATHSPYAPLLDAPEELLDAATLSPPARSGPLRHSLPTGVE